MIVMNNSEKLANFKLMERFREEEREARSELIDRELLDWIKDNDRTGEDKNDNRIRYLLDQRFILKEEIEMLHRQIESPQMSFSYKKDQDEKIEGAARFATTALTISFGALALSVMSLVLHFF